MITEFSIFTAGTAFGFVLCKKILPTKYTSKCPQLYINKGFGVENAELSTIFSKPIRVECPFYQHSTKECKIDKNVVKCHFFK